MRTPQHKRKLTPRDLRILRHVARFGLTTFEVLHRAFFHGREPDAVKSTLRRLCGDSEHPERPRFLQSKKLAGQRVYYRLTWGGSKVIGVTPRPMPYGTQALYQRIAVLNFIHGDARSGRQLVSLRDLEKDFGIKIDQMPRHPCYIESSKEHIRLGLIVIDYRAHPSGTVRKATDVLAKFLGKGWFDGLIRDRAFKLTVLTLSEGKKLAIERNLLHAIAHDLRHSLLRLQASVGLGKHIEVSVEVINDLIDLVPPDKEDVK